MKRRTNKHRLLPLALTAMTASSLAASWNPGSASAARLPASKTQTFAGQVASVDHGPVQVSIVTNGKKITAVRVANSPEGGRSVSIQGQAIPILRQETLRAQSANINTVSGATDTSLGYINSLQSALRKAKQAKALK